MKGQSCTVSDLQPFTFDNFQSEHPVPAILKVQLLIASELSILKYILKYMFYLA